MVGKMVGKAVGLAGMPVASSVTKKVSVVPEVGAGHTHSLAPSY